MKITMREARSQLQIMENSTKAAEWASSVVFMAIVKAPLNLGRLIGTGPVPKILGKQTYARCAR